MKIAIDGLTSLLERVDRTVMPGRSKALSQAQDALSDAIRFLGRAAEAGAVLAEALPGVMSDVADSSARVSEAVASPSPSTVAAAAAAGGRLLHNAMSSIPGALDRAALLQRKQRDPTVPRTGRPAGEPRSACEAPETDDAAIESAFRMPRPMRLQGMVRPTGQRVR